MLIIEQLIVSYGDARVLDELELQLKAQLIHGVVGLNGAGKSTLFNAIYGFLKSKSGRITWNSKEIERTQFGYLPTANYFYSNLTGKEYLRLFKQGSTTYNQEIWSEILSLPLHDLIDTYSTGMKKKLALLSLLKQNKTFLILDEPFNGIDLETSRILLLLLKELKGKGKTILISSHILETLTTSCDFIHHLAEGKIKKSYIDSELDSIEDQLFLDLEKKHKDLLDQVL